MQAIRCGAYRVIKKLTEGGMGAIYIARHELMGNEVIIKMLLPEFSAKRELAKRFINEAQATAMLNNPGIVRVFDVGYSEDNRIFIAMEKLPGEDLKKRLRSVGHLSVDKAVLVVRQLARAVGFAHEHGVVHRDLKPENAFLVPDPEVTGGERIKVLDFGLAKLAEQKGSFATRDGAVFGTPAYMAPEQWLNAAVVDRRADLYAIGCIFFECVCGTPPFGRGGLELIARHLRDAPARPRTINPSVPEYLDYIIMELIQKDPDKRIQDCHQLIFMLDDYYPDVSMKHVERAGHLAAPSLLPGTPLTDDERQASQGTGASISSVSDAAGAMRGRDNLPSTQGLRSKRLVQGMGMLLVMVGAVAAIVMSRSTGEQQGGRPAPSSLASDKMLDASVEGSDGMSRSIAEPRGAGTADARPEVPDAAVHARKSREEDKLTKSKFRKKLNRVIRLVEDVQNQFPYDSQASELGEEVINLKTLDGPYGTAQNLEDFETLKDIELRARRLWRRLLEERD